MSVERVARPSVATQAPVTVVREVVAELVRRRDLFLNLVHAELTARYKTATLGVLWFGLNPIIMTLVLTAVFRYVVRLDIENYPVFLLVGLLPWTYFQAGLTSATISVTRALPLVKRVRIPRLFIPASTVVSALVQFVVSLVVLGVVMAVARVPLHSTSLLVPLVAIGATLR